MSERRLRSHQVPGPLATRACLLVAAFACAACADRTPVTSTAPTIPVSPSAADCAYVPDPAAVSVNAAGGPATAAVGTGPGCRWTAVPGSSADSWISVGTGTLVGPGAVSLVLQPNRSFNGRTGTLVVRNERGEVLATHAVTQRGAGCLYNLSLEARTLDWLGTYDGAGDSPFSVDVHAEPADCRWTAAASVPWIRIVYNSAAGTGDGTVYVSVVEWNRTPARRVGEVVIAGLSGVNPDAHLRVTQNAQ